MGGLRYRWKRTFGCLLLVVAVPIGFVVTLILFYGLAFGQWPIPSDALEFTEKRGNPVVGALKLYRADHGRYPQSLQELSPRYLDSIPPPSWGLKTWIYAAEKGGFDLRVHESIHTGNGVSRFFGDYDHSAKWELGD